MEMEMGPVTRNPDQNCEMQRRVCFVKRQKRKVKRRVVKRKRDCVVLLSLL